MTKAHIRTWLAVAALWTAIGLLNGVQWYQSTHREGSVPIDLGPALLWQTATWFTWAVFTPIIAAMAMRVPLRRAPGPVVFHIVASIVTAAAWILVSEALSGLNPRLPWTQARPFMSRYVARLVPSLQFQFDVLVYWSIVVATQIIVHRRRLNERDRQATHMRERLVTAELHALRLQLQPHFLFNTLHAIGSLVRENEGAAAIATLEQLSRMLRLTLDTGSRNTVPLAQELEMARLYADIQTTRFGDYLRFVFDVPAATLDVPVPSLLLQPLVENAVRHGVSMRDEPGEVIIAALLQGSDLVLTVKDNGPGVRPSNASAGGLGLSITRERLSLLYGSAARLTLADGPDRGAVVTVTLPIGAAAS